VSLRASAGAASRASGRRSRPGPERAAALGFAVGGEGLHLLLEMEASDRCGDFYRGLERNPVKTWQIRKNNYKH